jgi:Ca-activated chloride channel homolog
MSVARPAFLALLVLLVPLTGFFVLRYRRARTETAAVLGSWREDEYLTRWQAVYFFRSLSFALAYCCLVFALSGFSWGVRPVLERHSGLEIACAIDVSRSMELRDVEPSRLGRSIELCQQLVSSLPGTRFSLTVFKGDATVEIPATEDAESIAQFLPHAKPTLLSSRGTDLERGIDVAIDSFRTSDASMKLLVLFSDGESLAGNPLVAARAAKAKGIRIFSIGAGTDEGALVSTGTGTNAVRSRLKPDILKAVADLSDGAYYPISDPRALRDVIDLAQKAGVGALTESYRYEPVDHYQLFIIAAVILLIVYLGVGALPWVEK